MLNISCLSLKKHGYNFSLVARKVGQYDRLIPRLLFVLVQ